MAQSQNVNGKSIAILRSAVRGVHVYKRIPSLNSRVSLDLCGDSNVTKRYPKAITASLNGNILGHIAGEHSKIVYRSNTQNKYYILNFLISWENNLQCPEKRDPAT